MNITNAQFILVFNITAFMAMGYYLLELVVKAVNLIVLSNHPNLSKEVDAEDWFLHTQDHYILVALLTYFMVINFLK